MWSRHFTMWFGTPARRWRRDSMYVSSCVRFPGGKIHTRFLGKIRSRFSEKYDFPRKHRPLEITPQLPLALVSGRKRSSQGMVAIGGKEGFCTFFVSKFKKKVDNTYDMTHAIQAWLSPKQTDTLSLHIICKPTQTMQLPQLRFLKWLAYLLERLEGTLLWFW